MRSEAGVVVLDKLLLVATFVDGVDVVLDGGDGAVGRFFLRWVG